MKAFADMSLRDRFSTDSSIRTGKPCVRGTRIAIADVLGYLAGGMTVSEVLDDFPDLIADDVQACFAFAADRERRMSVVPQAA